MVLQPDYMFHYLFRDVRRNDRFRDAQQVARLTRVGA